MELTIFIIPPPQTSSNGSVLFWTIIGLCLSPMALLLVFNVTPSIFHGNSIVVFLEDYCAHFVLSTFDTS